MSTAIERYRVDKSARKLTRYMRSKAGMSPELIAKQDSISLVQVRKDIREMEEFEAINSEAQVQTMIRDMLRRALPQTSVTIDKLLTATTVVRIKNKKTGLEEDVIVPDKTVQAEAVRMVTGMVSTLQPKTPMVGVQVTQNTQVNTTVGKSETPEERIRRIRAQAAQHNQLPPEVVGVPAIIDAGGSIVEDDDEEDDD